MSCCSGNWLHPSGQSQSDSVYWNQTLWRNPREIRSRGPRGKAAEPGQSCERFGPKCGATVSWKKLSGTPNNWIEHRRFNIFNCAKAFSWGQLHLTQVETEVLFLVSPGLAVECYDHRHSTYRRIVGDVGQSIWPPQFAWAKHQVNRSELFIHHKANPDSTSSMAKDWNATWWHLHFQLKQKRQVKT